LRRQRQPLFFVTAFSVQSNLLVRAQHARQATTEITRMSMLDLMMVSGVVLLIVLIIAKKRMG
jgi:hypothetical protein